MPKGGRPKGAKNKSTLLREALNHEFEEALKIKFEAVVNAVVNEAVSGNMVAAKMLLDRIIPVHKAADFKKTPGGAMEITINVDSLRSPSIRVEAEDADYEDIEDEE